MALTDNVFSLVIRDDGDDVLRVTLLGPDGVRVSERHVGNVERQDWWQLGTNRGMLCAQAAKHGLEEVLQRASGELFAAFFGDTMPDVFAHAATPESPILLQVRVPPSRPEFLALPWTRMHVGGTALADRGILVATTVDGELPAIPSSRSGAPLRVLVLYAAPRGLDVPQANAELAEMRQLYGAARVAASLTVLSHGASESDILEAWEAASGFDIVHFLCRSRGGALLLEGAGGRPAAFQWDVLDQACERYGPPTLAVLGTGCSPADPWWDRFAPGTGLPIHDAWQDVDDPLGWAAVGAALLRRGTPVVLGFDLPMEARAARFIWDRFTRAMLRGEEPAIAALRTAVSALDDVREGFGTTGVLPFLWGNGAFTIKGLEAGRAQLGLTRPRRGIDLGLFPEGRYTSRLAGHYHAMGELRNRIRGEENWSALVLGPSGIGKTSFAENVLRATGDEVVAVLRIHASPRLTAEGVHGAVSDLCLANDWPLPAAPSPAPGEADGAEARGDRFARSIVQAVNDRKVVIVFDELERALVETDKGAQFRDVSLGRMVSGLCLQLQGSGIWLLSTLRPVLAETDWLPELVLSEPDPWTARDLFNTVPELAGLDIDIQRQIYQVTRGLPGVLGALALLEREQHLLETLSDLVTSRLGSASPAEYRETMARTLVRAAMSALPSDVVRAIAVIGNFESPERTFALGHLGAPLSEEQHKLLAAAGLVERYQMRDPVDQATDRGALYLWAAEPVRSAARLVASKLPIPLEEVAHRMGRFHAARAVERRTALSQADGRAEERSALEGQQAALCSQAVSYLCAAGRWEEAAEALRSAVAVLSNGVHRYELRRMLETIAPRARAGGTGYLDLLLELVDLYRAEGLSAVAVSHCERILKALRGSNDTGHSAAVLLRLASIASDRGELEEAHGHLEAARAASERAAEPSLRAEVEVVAARVHELEGEVDAAAEALDRAATWFIEASRPEPAAEALATLADTRVRLGDAEGALKVLARATALDPASIDGNSARVRLLVGALGTKAADIWREAAEAEPPQDLFPAQ